MYNTTFPVIDSFSGSTTFNGESSFNSSVNFNSSTQFLATSDFNSNILKKVDLLNFIESVNALGNSSGNVSINLSLGNVVTATATGDITWSFSTTAASGKCCSFLLILKDGGAHSMNWGLSVDWPSGTPPTLTASGYDILIFFTIDGSTTWLGVNGAKDIK